jgi:glutamyl-tRNA synthetase
MPSRPHETADEGRIRELKMAGRIQADILPEGVPEIPGWDIAARLISARETSGDFFDFIPLDNQHWGIVVGDVTDKSIGAALFMALTSTLIRTYAVRYPTLPALAMDVVNQRMLSDTRGNIFVTAFYGVLEQKIARLRFVNAGHPPALLVGSRGAKPIDLLKPTGAALGMLEKTHWRQKVVKFQPGDVLFLYTDGITEAQNSYEEFYGIQRLMKVLRLYAGQGATRLLAADLAYYCYCTPAELEAERKRQEAAHEKPRYNGRCARLSSVERVAFEAEGRQPVVRFRIPAGRRIAFDDIVRGHVDIDTDELGGDLVIVRSDGTPLYHFTVVVDDAAMAISHVIRGEDHLSNTPKHILLFRALGHAVPAFAHLPLILNPDRTKLSKRKSQTAISDYIAQGFIREALVNYLALLGWSPGTGEEVLSLPEIVERFEIDRVQKGGAIFDRERLEWLNGQWIRRLDPDVLVDRLRPFLQAELDAGRIDRMPADDELRPLVPVIQERLPVLGSIGELIGFLFRDRVDADPALLVPRRWDAATTAEALGAARHVVAEVGPVSYEAEEIEPPMRALAEARGWKPGDLFMAIRVAVTGRTAAPPLFDTLVALGYERTLERLDAAIAALAAVA